MFDRQAMHVEFTEAPTAVEYVPIPQSVHDASADPPVSTRYLPAPHAVHDASADPPDSTRYLPEPQAVHDASTVPPVSARYLPAPQAVHAADPVDALYFPATHAVHAPPAGPLHPALQVQLVKAVLPAGEMVFDGQAMHVEFTEAPTAVEYVPIPQSVQLADPVDVLYLPGAHAMHCDPE